MRKNGLVLVAVAFVALLGGCKTVSIDGQYEGTLTLAEDTCNPWETAPVWTVLDVRVRNDDETLVNLVLTDYDNYSLLDVGVESDGSYTAHQEEDTWFTHNVTDAFGMLDGEVASLDLTIAVFFWDENGLPQEDEFCHLSYTFVGDKRYLSRPPAD